MKSANTCSSSANGDQQSFDREEVLGFDARFLLELPLNTSLVLRAPGFSEDVIWTTRVLEKPRLPSQQILFDKDEVLALISASEAERAWPKNLREWCWMKRECSDFIVDVDKALSGTRPTIERNWNLGRVLEWFELDLVSITVADTAEKGNDSVAEAA